MSRSFCVLVDEVEKLTPYIFILGSDGNTYEDYRDLILQVH